MGNVLIGTSSWADKGLVECGKFYPPEVKSAEDRLRYYARQFPVVQVDSAWYALPTERTARLWVDRTPDDFVFDIKLFRLFTRHQTPVAALPPDIRKLLLDSKPAKAMVYYDDMPVELRDELWEQYRQAILPLHLSGKLGTVLLQMAPWVGPGHKSKSHLLECKKKLGDIPTAVEFRNAAWFADGDRGKTLDFLAANDFTHVVVDEPQGFRNSVPLVPFVTTPNLAYLRMHGRNKATWDRKDLSTSADRFNYDYTDEELGELVPVARQLADHAGQVHVMFNNNYQDQSQRNAKQMSQLLLTGGS